MTTTPAAAPEAAPAWWIHWLNLAIAAVSFVGVAVHPGWHPPNILVEVVGPLSIVLAVGSGVVFAVLHHKAGVSNLTAAYTYVTGRAGELTAAATALAPLVERYPAVEARLTALEASPVVAVLPADVQHLLDVQHQVAAVPPTPLPAAPDGPPAAATAP